MPKKGYTAITVKNKVAERLHELAENSGRSVPEVIEALMDERRATT